MSEWLNVLNNEQRTAVENTEGYVCLHAGAGTGKTKTLTYRYAYLISEYGISPRAVWCVTFTNKAAAEMKERVKALCGSTIGNPFITTFHGFCASFLREEIMAIGWPKTFTIADVNDVKEILRPLYHELDIKGTDLSLRKAWAYIDETKEGKTYISDFIGADTTAMLERAQDTTLEPQVRLFWRYLFAQRTTYTLDFDDLILLTLHILKGFPEVRARWQERLEYILVDEFQDIDRDQYELVEILAGYNQNLFIVGDPDQTIYSFRGARVEFFKGFAEAHADEGGLQLHLTKNYRSHGNILQAAYSVISNNLDPDRKPLIPMRTDITLDDMVAVVDPDYQEEEKLEQDVVDQIQSKSYLGQERAKSYKQNHAPEQTLYYDPTQDQSYSSPFGDDDFSSLFEDDCSDVVPDEFDSKPSKEMRDRLKPTIGFKKEAKLRRLGINYDEDDVDASDSLFDDATADTYGGSVGAYGASAGTYGAAAGAYGGASSDDDNPFAQMGVGQVTEGSSSDDDSDDYEEAYFPPVGTATNMGRGRYGYQTAAKNRFRGHKPKPVHTIKPIVAHAANSFIEAKFVARTIQDIQQRDPQSSIAVLYRSHFIAVILEQEMAARKIRYNMVGELSFFDRKEIRDVIAYMRLRVNLDDDVAFRRIVNVPPRRFGKKRIERLEEIARQQRCSLFRALSYGIDDPFLNPSGNMSKFIDMMTKVANAPFRNPSDDLEIILSSSGYDEFLKSTGEDERLEKLGSLRNYLSDFKKNHDDDVNIADFIGQISLMNSAESTGETSPVSLMTVHNAKGLEFDYVFVISLNESIFPTKNSINEQNVAEERRLMYVAMTRACKQLIMIEAGGELLNRAKKEKFTRQPSRFIEELKADDFVALGEAPKKEDKAQKQKAVTTPSYNPDRLVVGERFHHKILGYGHVVEVRDIEAEYVVYYEKLKKQRTLSFSHSDKIERLGLADGTAAPQPATQQKELIAAAQHPDQSQPQAQTQAQAPANVQEQVPANVQEHAPAVPAYAEPVVSAQQYHGAAAVSPYATPAATPTVAPAASAYAAPAASPYGAAPASSPYAAPSPFGAYGDDDDGDNSMSVEQFLNSTPVDPLARSGSPYGSDASPYGNDASPFAQMQPNEVVEAPDQDTKKEDDGPTPAEIVMETRAYRPAVTARMQQHAAQSGHASAPASPYEAAEAQPAQSYAQAAANYATYQPQQRQMQSQQRVSSYEKATEKFKNAGYGYGLPPGFNLDRDEIEEED